jgi:hypothetical protein
MVVLLTLLSAIVVVIFFAVVAFYVRQIAVTLEAIGGNPSSYLAKLRYGLRAIEQETGHLPTQVTILNQGLTQIAGGLQQVDTHLVNTIEAVVRQGQKEQKP